VDRAARAGPGPTRGNSAAGRNRTKGEEMSAAETSAYLLMAGGLIWVNAFRFRT